MQLVIPAFNEEARLPRTLGALRSHVLGARESVDALEVIVVDNASTDDTARVARRASSAAMPVRVVSCERRGKGAAVRAGIAATSADLVGFMDADGATDLTALETGARLVAAGADVAIASRAVPGSVTTERHSRLRAGGATVYRRLAREIAPGIADTQCGLKLLRGDLARTLFAAVRTDGFSFDVELLGRAQRHGARIEEFPALWTDVPGSTFVPLASYRGCRVVRVRTSTKPGAQVRAALDDLRPDVVHVADPGRLGRAALDHAARLGVASVVVQHSPLDVRDEERWRHRVAARADTLLVTATWMAEHLATQGVRADVWLPGVDTAAFCPALRDPRLHDAWSRGGTQVVVGYVGALRRRHGVRRLVDLDALPGVRPVVIGDGPQRDRLRARMPGTRFSSALGTGDLATALATLDVLVHPGTHETCCHVLRAAAASGVPVVAPRCGGARDVVRTLETGLLHDPADPRGLADAVLALASDRRRGLLGARARELALTRGWPTAVDELVTRHYPARARAA